MKYAFLHEFAGERDKLKSHKCIYIGKPGVVGDFDFIIAEPPISTFEECGDDELSWCFSVADTYKDTPKLIFRFPVEFVEGIAKGYTIEFSEFLEDIGFSSIQILKVDHPYYGAAISGDSIYLIAGEEPTPMAKSINTVKTKASGLFPNIITHAKVNPDNIDFTSGAGTLHGFARSNYHCFPALEAWRDQALMVERRDGDTLNISRITTKEIAELFGVENKPSLLIDELRSIVPTVVHDTFISRFI